MTEHDLETVKVQVSFNQIAVFHKKTLSFRVLSIDNLRKGFEMFENSKENIKVRFYDGNSLFLSIKEKEREEFYDIVFKAMDEQKKGYNIG